MDRDPVSKLQKSELPINKNFSGYESGYTPEQFTQEEIQILNLFFTNTDKPIFCIHDLPEEVIGALSSLYSRSTKSMRRTFLDNFVGPIIDLSNIDSLPAEDREEFLQNRSRFQRVISQMSIGDRIEEVSNTRRGREFYERWLGFFGDDSIGEQAGFHAAMEGVSNLVTDAIKRLNLPHITKSTRYVDFGQKDVLGRYGFVTPGEIRSVDVWNYYQGVMNTLFDLYSSLYPSYREYIERLYPKGEDETSGSFSKSREARVFDDLRSLLPFSTKTNFGMYTNARTYSMMIDRMIGSPIGEVRWAGQSLYQEIKKLGPSLVSKAETERGALLQIYVADLNRYKLDIAARRSSSAYLPELEDDNSLVKLVDILPDSFMEEVVLSQLKFEDDNQSYEDILEEVKSLSSEDKEMYFQKFFHQIREKDLPQVTRLSIKAREVPEAFEAVKFVFEGLIMGGDYRDLSRHRMVRFIHQPFTAEHGYFLEKDMRAFGKVGDVRRAFEQVVRLYSLLENEVGVNVAQYAVPFAFLQRYMLEASARQLYWIGELRSGPQGRMHYSKQVRSMIAQAREKCPLLFMGNYTEMGTLEAISRRESEFRAERKRKLKKL